MTSVASVSSIHVSLGWLLWNSTNIHCSARTWLFLKEEIIKPVLNQGIWDKNIMLNVHLGSSNPLTRGGLKNLHSHLESKVQNIKSYIGQKQKWHYSQHGYWVIHFTLLFVTWKENSGSNYVNVIWNAVFRNSLSQLW